jgi:hypothetical protein
VLLYGRYAIDRSLIAWLDRFTSSLPAKAVGVGRDAGAHPIEIGRIVPDPGPPRRSFDEDASDRTASPRR